MALSPWAESPGQVWGLSSGGFLFFSGKPVKFSGRISLWNLESCGFVLGLREQACCPGASVSLCLSASLCHTHTHTHTHTALSSRAKLNPAGNKNVEFPTSLGPRIGGTGQSFSQGQTSGTPQESLKWHRGAVGIVWAGCRWTRCRRACAQPSPGSGDGTCAGAGPALPAYSAALGITEGAGAHRQCCDMGGLLGDALRPHELETAGQLAPYLTMNACDKECVTCLISKQRMLQP